MAAPVEVVGVGHDAQPRGRQIPLGLGLDEPREPRGPPDQDDEEPGRERIQRAGVPHRPRPQHPTDPVHHIVRGESRRLVHEHRADQLGSSRLRPSSSSLIRAACARPRSSLEVELRHRTGRERPGRAGPEETGGASQPIERPLPVGRLARHAHHDAGVGQVGRDQHAGHRHEADPRVAHLAREAVGDDLAQRLRHLLRAPPRRSHRHTVMVSTMRTPSAASMTRSADRRVSSTTGRAVPTAAQAISARCHRS